MSARNPKTQTLMVQGTTSDAGKSLVVTAICRLLKRHGVRVVPFKPQNMALNSAVTIDGGEIGRAQAVQAQACGLQSHTDMNPILLKPSSDKRCQVIIHGKVMHNLSANQYHKFKLEAMTYVETSYHRLAQNFDAIVVEGAGSPAEINLRSNDVANMGFAERVDCPVIIVGDIDRGGVFAQFVGTLELLSASEQQRIQGFIINKFRGDISLLEPGITWLQQKTGKPVLAVLPFIHGLYLASEDSFFDAHLANNHVVDALKVVVPRLSRLSNHTDLDPLAMHPGVELVWVGAGEPIPGADLVILPGSKCVATDLAWLRVNGWECAIQRHLRYGGKLLGICGGFQMLGNTLDDPDGVEGPSGSVAGLGLLPMRTQYNNNKQLINSQGYLTFDHVKVSGYEIHQGETSGSALEKPVMFLNGLPHGAISEDNQIIGCYLHGLFDQPDACNSLLTWAGLSVTSATDMVVKQNEEIERLADTLVAHMDMTLFWSLLNLTPPAKL